MTVFVYSRKLWLCAATVAQVSYLCLNSNRKIAFLFALDYFKSAHNKLNLYFSKPVIYKEIWAASNFAWNKNLLFICRRQRRVG